MKARFSSRWANNLARLAITLAAAGVFLGIRPDLFARASSEVGAIYQQKVASPRLIETYLRNHKLRKLQIGAGINHNPEWLNTDIEPSGDQAFLDATKPFPLPDASFQFIIGEQVIEHITYEQGIGMLKEAYRVLAPGGKVRIATPNLLQYFALFGPQDEKIKEFIPRKLDYHYWPQTPDPACYILNAAVRSWGHQFIYTPKMLRASFEKAGFTTIKQFAPGASDDADSTGLEIRSHGEFKDIDKFESMVFEAVR